MWSEIDLAYCAGILDGEGCVGSYNTRSSYDHGRSANWSLTVRIAMKTPYAVQKFYNLFGGSLKVHKAKGPTKPGPYFIWVAHNRRAELVLAALLPHLGEKKEQAELALEFCAFKREQRRNSHYNKKYSEEIIKSRQEYARRLSELKRKVFTLDVITPGSDPKPIEPILERVLIGRRNSNG